MRLVQAIQLPLIFVFVVLGCAGCKPKPADQPIHGYVVANLNSDVAGASRQQGADIAVPDVEVVAKNVASGVLSARTRTDPFGYFRTPALPAGNYQICVSGKEFASSCDPAVVSVDARVRVLDHSVSIRPALRAVFGSVVLADNTTPCFWYRPDFDANFVMTAKISLEDAAGTVIAGPVRGNNSGRYVLPTSAGAGSYNVRVVCEASKAAAKVTLSAAGALQNFVLSDHVPQLRLLEASKGSVGVRRANPGDVVQVVAPATDPDGNPIHYRWIDENNPTQSFPDSPTVSWSLPSANLYSLHVQVSNGHGGYTVGRTVVSAGADEVLFYGTVFDRTSHAPIDHAAVSLNGVATTTNAQGLFQIKVPDADRFTLNVSKPEYALTSRIFYTHAIGLEIPLDKAQSVAVNGATGGTVTVRVTGCADGRDAPRGAPAETVAEKAAAARGSQKDSACRRQEVIGDLSFKFQPNSFELNGHPYTGPVTVEAFQFDLTLPNPIPGDFSATYQSQSVRLETFGAFHILPRDSAGHALRLATGKSAEASMPIHPLALATAPATIPFFSYEEASGLWVEHGKLLRAGGKYVGKITHFSDFNADTIGNGSACLKVQLDANFPSTVRLNATYINGVVGNFNHPNDVITDAFNPIAIERLVPNQDFQLVIDDNTAAHNVLQTVTLNSGVADAVGFPVQYPYNGCNGPITIHYNTIPTPPNFLVPATIVDNSADYKTQTTTGFYQDRDTLTGNGSPGSIGWKGRNGFPASGNAPDETNAAYFNNGDLKFGRSMHCRITGHTGAGDSYACYVSNFGNVGTDDSVAALIDTYANTNIQATVAMEYHPDQTNKVQFWAYLANGNYFPNPKLDAQGNKPMPDICIACHQGSYGGAGKTVNGAIFLPFDVDSFLGDDGKPLPTTLGTGAPRPTQAAFRQLNQWAYLTAGGSADAAIQSLMDLWYKDAGHPTGVNDAAATYHFNQGAAGLGTFGTNGGLYDAVVKPACRTCHIARSPGFDAWDTFAEMSSLKGLIQRYACNAPAGSTNLNMPHAEVPFKRFWQESLSSTLASELAFSPPDCSN